MRRNELVGGTLEVLYYFNAFGKGEKPEPKHFEAINKLFAGQLHSVNPEKIYSDTDFSVFSIRYGGKQRLLLTHKYYQGKSYYIILEDLPEHEYDQADTSTSQKMADCLKAFDESLRNRLFVPFENNHESQQKGVEQEGVKPFYYFDRKFIVLNAEQQQVLSAELPLYLSGPPGSGKTLVDLVVLEKKFNEKCNVLYVTQSPVLASKVREIRNDKYIFNKGKDEVDFSVLSYGELLKLVDSNLKNKNAVGKDEFSQWLNHYFNTRKQKKFPAAIINRKEEIYEELRNLSGYEKGEYLKLGQRESLFVGQDERLSLCEIYKEYQKYLDQQSQYDVSFYEIKDYSLFENYVVAIDEVDNLSTLQIKQLAKFGKFKDVILTGDSHQLITDSLPKRSFIERLFGKAGSYKELQFSMRNGGAIVAFLNQFIEFKYQVTGGLTDRHEQVQLNAAGDKKGSVEWVKDVSQKSLELLQKKYAASGLVVITHPYFIDEAKKAFPDNLVCTYEQSKGCEFKYVAVYRPFDAKPFDEVNKLLATEGPKKDRHNRAKNGDYDHRYVTSLNGVFVGCSRAMEGLIICQGENHHTKNILKRLSPGMGEAVVQVAPQAGVMDKKKSIEERYEQAKEWLRNGSTELADQERDKLPAPYQANYDDYKKQLQVKRQEQARQENEKHERRKEKQETKNSQSFKEKSIKDHSHVKKEETKVNKIPTSLNGLVSLLKRPDGMEILFETTEAGTCMFSEMIEHKDKRKILVDLAKKHPELIKKVPFKYFLKSYFSIDRDSNSSCSLIVMLLIESDLHEFIKTRVTNLNDGESKLLYQSLFLGFIKKDDTQVCAVNILTELDVNIFRLVLSNCPGLINYINYSDISQPKNSAHGLEKSLLEILSETKKGSMLIHILLKAKSKLLDQLEPSALFRMYETILEEESDSEDEYFTCALNNLLRNLDNCQDLLAPWFSSANWVKYLVASYVYDASDKPDIFIQDIVKPFLFSDKFYPSPAFFRLLQQESSFLKLLIEDGLFSEFSSNVEWFFFKYLADNNITAAQFIKMIASDVKLIHYVFPDNFLNLTLKMGEENWPILSGLLAHSPGRKLVKLIAQDRQYIKNINLTTIFKIYNEDESISLFEYLLRTESLHWFLEKLFEEPSYMVEFLINFFDFKLSEGDAFSMMCRFCPALILKFEEKFKKFFAEGSMPASLANLPPVKIIFKKREISPSDIYWLEKYPPAHEFLLRVFKSDPVLLYKLPAERLGNILKLLEPKNTAVSPLHCLAQTNAGREILRMYIERDREGARSFATASVLCTPLVSPASEFEELDVFGILIACSAIGLVEDLLHLNSNMIKEFSLAKAQQLREVLQDKNLLEKIDVRIREERENTKTSVVPNSLFTAKSATIKPESSGQVLSSARSNFPPKR